MNMKIFHIMNKLCIPSINKIKITHLINFPGSIMMNNTITNKVNLVQEIM